MPCPSLSRRSASYLPPLLALTSCAPGWAETPAPSTGTDSPTDLPAVVVTATRTDEPVTDIPYSTSLVEAGDLERRLSRTTPEALRELPSVMLQKTGHGQGSPYLRGFTGFRTLMLVDGIRLNNSTFRDGPNQYWGTVDSLSLQRLEVVRGPASVLYGSDAIGGTVNALTRSRELEAGGFDWDPRAFYRFSSAEDSHTGRAEIGANWDRDVGVNAGTTFKEYGDLRGGEDVGVQSHTGYSERDWDGKVTWRLNDSVRLVYAHQTVDQDDAWRSHATIYGKSWRGTAPGTDFSRIFDQIRHLDYLQLHATGLEGGVDELHASVSYQVQEERETRLRSDLRRELQGVSVGTIGLWLQAQSETPVGRLIYGAEFYHDTVDSDFRRYSAAGALQVHRRQGPVADDSTYDLFGAYLEDHVPLAGDRLEAIVGGRYSHAGVEIGRAEDPATAALLTLGRNWDTVVGNGRLLWHLDEEKHWNLFAGASQGFRAPNLSDLSRFDIARSGEQEVPSPGLEPERFVSLETGARAQWRRVAVEAAVYQTFFDDLVVGVPTGQRTADGLLIVSKQNGGEGFVRGAELTASVEFVEHWTLWGNLSWMEGRVETPLVQGGAIQKEPLSRIMPATANLGLRWDHPKRKYWAEFASTIARTQDLLSSGDARDTQRIPPGGTPGYEVYHLRAGWRPCEDFTLSLALENLGNADYRIHGSGLNEPGRNLIVAADVRF